MNSEDQKQNRKFGQDRLKIKINFTPEQQFLDCNTQDDGLITFDSKYDVGPVIGQGAHAVVKKAWKKNQQNRKKTYAVKIVRSADSEIQDSVQRTYDTVSKLSHPGIIKVKELFIDEKIETSYLVMQYCNFPSLDSILIDRISSQNVRKFLSQLIEAVQYLHDNFVCHRDLKPDNILVNLKTGAIKIVDFGVSSYCNQAMWTKTGNVFYGAPEIHTKCGYTEKIDVWAIGVILYQCLTGCLPFQEQSVISTIHKITNVDYNSHWENSKFKCLPLNTQDLLKNMLERNPENRFSAKQCLEHGFFNENLHFDHEMILLDNFKIIDLRSREQLEKHHNDSFEDMTLENSLNSSFDFKPQIHRIKGITQGGIDFVSSFHLSGGSQSRIKIPNINNNNNSMDDLLQLINSHNYQKSNSHDNLGQFISMDNLHDTSFDILAQKHQMAESIININIVEEEDESIDQI